MKTTIFIQRIAVMVLIAVSSLFIFSCDNSFLDETKIPDYTELQDTIYVTNGTGTFQIDLNFNTNNACDWRLAQYPLWLVPSNTEGTKGANDYATMQFSVYDANITVDLGFYSFPLVFDIDGEKLVGYTIVLANLGHPIIQVSGNSVSFDYSLNSSIKISNNSYGILNWSISSAPAWLEAETTYGLIDSNESEILNLSANLNGLDPGEYNGTLVIESNAENQKTVNISVSLSVGASALYSDYFEGQLIDTRFSKDRDEVIVLTKSPNQLIFFKHDLNDPVTFNLDRVPQCLALSQDETLLAVAYSNAEITTYNAINRNTIKTYNANAIPLSIEFTTGNYLYFIASQGYNNYLHSLNLDSEEIIRQKGGESGMKTLKKVPEKPVLVSSRPGYSPDGLLLFDISEPGQTDSLNLYHMDLEGYWISEDGTRLFSGWKRIYNLPDFVEGQDFFPYELTQTGLLDFEASQVVECISDHTASQRISAAFGFHGEGNNLILNTYNSKTLVQQKSYELTYPRPDFFSVYSTWSGRVVALFHSDDEQNVWIVQKHAEYSSDNGIWSVSKVNVTK